MGEGALKIYIPGNNLKRSMNILRNIKNVHRIHHPLGKRSESPHHRLYSILHGIFEMYAIAQDARCGMGVQRVNHHYHQVRFLSTMLVRALCLIRLPA